MQKPYKAAFIRGCLVRQGNAWVLTEIRVFSETSPTATTHRRFVRLSCNDNMDSDDIIARSFAEGLVLARQRLYMYQQMYPGVSVQMV